MVMNAPRTSSGRNAWPAESGRQPADDERQREEMKREQAHGPEGLLLEVRVLPIFVFEARPAAHPIKGKAKAVEGDTAEHEDLACIELSSGAGAEREPGRWAVALIDLTGAQPFVNRHERREVG